MTGAACPRLAQVEARQRSGWMKGRGHGILLLSVKLLTGDNCWEIELALTWHIIMS